MKSWREEISLEVGPAFIVCQTVEKSPVVIHENVPYFPVEINQTWWKGLNLKKSQRFPYLPLKEHVVALKRVGPTLLSPSPQKTTAGSFRWWLLFQFKASLLYYTVWLPPAAGFNGEISCWRLQACMTEKATPFHGCVEPVRNSGVCFAWNCVGKGVEARCTHFWVFSWIITPMLRQLSESP